MSRQRTPECRIIICTYFDLRRFPQIESWKLQRFRLVCADAELQEQGDVGEGGARSAQQAAVLHRGADQQTAAGGSGPSAAGGLPVRPGLQGGEHAQEKQILFS